MPDFFLTPEFVKEWNRVRKKVDTISGPGVINHPGFIIINPPTGGGNGKRGSAGDDSSTVMFPARVTLASAVVTGKKQWIYTIVEIQKTGTSDYGNWFDKPGGRTGPAYNFLEDNNAASGTFGNGMSSSNFKGTFTIKPVPVGTRIQIQEINRTDGGSPEYWFSYENGVDGACE